MATTPKPRRIQHLAVPIRALGCAGAPSSIHQALRGGDGVVLRDLGSRNGLIYKGRRLRKVLLCPGEPVEDHRANGRDADPAGNEQVALRLGWRQGKIVRRWLDVQPIALVYALSKAQRPAASRPTSTGPLAFESFK